MSHDKLNARDSIAALMNAGGTVADRLQVHGHYDLECHDENGNTLWTDTIENIVVTTGMNTILNQSLGVSGAVTPAFMGLYAAATPPTLAVTDTMATHSAIEATGTNAGYGTTRPTITFAAASGGAIATSSTNSFVFTNSGTIQSGFIVNGSGASATVGTTTGTLMSEGNLTTPQPVVSGNTITMSYTLTL